MQIQTSEEYYFWLHFAEVSGGTLSDMVPAMVGYSGYSEIVSSTQHTFMRLETQPL
jgi:hypothetical protein